MTEKINSKWFKFINYIEAYRKEENRGALATLRRSLGTLPELDIRSFPIVYPGIKFAELTKFQEKEAFIIAALYSYYFAGSLEQPSTLEKYWNFGDSFRLLLQDDEKGSRSIESRFIALLNAHEDDLIHHLKKNVSLLKSRNIVIDWIELAFAIQNWAHPKRIVQTRWAQSFYSTPKKENKKIQNTKIKNN